MENRLAPYPDHIPFHAGVQAIVEEASPFLREKRSEFLLNAVLNFPRTMPKKEFFEDLAALIPNAEAACEICAGAFAAEGRDAHGRLPRQTCIDLADEDDFDEERWTPQRMENMRCAGPFDNGKDLADGLKTVWETFRGLGSLRCALMDAVRQNLESIRVRQEGRDAVRERFEGLRRMAGLTRVEFDLLVYVFLHREGHCDWSRFVDGDEAARNVQQTMVYCKVAAACLGTRNERIRRALAPDVPLVRYGWVDPRHCELGCGVSLYLGGLSDTPAENFFYHPLDARPLPWEYFDEKTRELGACAEELVRARRGKGGVNLLLHGAPGTGKTSFALAFARRLGMKAYGISFGASSGRAVEGAGDEVSQASFRFGALDVADRNCRPGRDLIVVDEADTLLARAGANRLNDALDGSRCVRLWITNLDPSDLPNSNLRRFDLALPFEPLGPRQRAMIWRNSLARNRIGDLLGEDAVEDFAERYPVSAGGISRVCDNLAAMRRRPSARRRAAAAKHADGAASAPAADAVALARTLVENHARLLDVPFRRADAADAVSRGYVLDGLAIRGAVPLPDVLAAARRHLERLEAGDRGDAAAGLDAPRFNLLLSGPPGCGKTEFVRYLGERLGREVRSLGASDLLRPFVGETEERIRGAFENAARDGAVLFFDEIDSVLRTREGAVRSWEVSQVNEILARMEGFRGVFVAATNYLESLDPAVLRRFTFKLAFGYLDRAGKRTFFERFFRTPLTTAEEEELAAIPRLCPGDFRTVRQSLWYLPGGSDNARRLAALREESAQKERLGAASFDRPDRRPVGF